MTFRANERADCHTVGRAVAEAIPYSRQPHFAAFLIANKIMIPPMWMRFMLLLLRLRGNYQDRLTYFFSRSREIASDLLEQAGEHITWGKDQIDSDSVGGLCQAEMDLVVGELRRIGVLSEHLRREAA